MQIKNNILRCSNCGGSDIEFDEESGKLKCKHCRSLIDGVMANEADDVSSLKGKIIFGGAKKIIDEKMMVTLKCSACGAEVTINTDEATSARCPWCRHVLSITDKLPNGTVPDLILPFKVKHKEAVEEIRSYIGRRRSLAKRDFVNDFKEEAVMGLYLPYMVIDMNVHAKMSGVGEVETRKYTVGTGDSQEVRYDADVFDVSREFDLAIDDLTIEASSDRLNQNTRVNTNNVINAIMPFDTEKAVDWDPRYVRGFSCEHRDVDVEDLDRRVKLQVEDIMRYRMHGAIMQYDRGVRWDKMQLTQNGVKWKTAYLPVWLYSYLDTQPDGKSVLHYVAVNGRTKEVVGSTPIEWGRVFFKVILFPLVTVIMNLAMALLARYNIKNDLLTELVLVLGVFGMFWLPIAAIIVGLKAGKFRNRSARHMYEQETRAKVENVVSVDTFSKTLKNLSRGVMVGRNDNAVKGVLQTGEKASTSIGKGLLMALLIVFGMFLCICCVMYNVRSYSNAPIKNMRSHTEQNVRDIMNR